MYQLMYEGEKPSKAPTLSKSEVSDITWGRIGKSARLLAKFRHLFSHEKEGDRKMLMAVAEKMAKKKAGRLAD